MISQTPERVSGILSVSRTHFENHCSRSWAGTFVFSVKAYTVCILDFVAHLVSLEMTQFCCFTRKATTGNTKQWARLCCIWPMGCSVPVPAPDSGKNQMSTALCMSTWLAPSLHSGFGHCFLTEIFSDEPIVT